MKKIFVGASWKMYKTVKEGTEYINDLQDFMDEKFVEVSNITVFVLPTFLAIDAFSKNICHSNLKYGSQNCFWEDEGPYTGEVSPMHLKDLGCSFVELGHPERKSILKEDLKMINKKIKACIRNDIIPVICMGEEEKPQKTSDATDFIELQLDVLLKGIKEEDIAKIILAYEPAWAIGESEAADTSYIGTMMDHIRNFLASRYGEELYSEQLIIYGGSVNKNTAKNILEIRENNGIFIGRASLDIELFKYMINVALEINN
ncbi:MAG: triose-phosphate isomerase family protein [Actinomycetota bacterium]